MWRNVLSELNLRRLEILESVRFFSPNSRTPNTRDLRRRRTVHRRSAVRAAQFRWVSLLRYAG